jgi:hypothetical protein
MAVVQKVLRHADPRITSERYAHLEQDYLGGGERELPHLRPEANGITDVFESPSAAPSQPSKLVLMRVDARERRKGFEPSTPSLGS